MCADGGGVWLLAGAHDHHSFRREGGAALGFFGGAGVLSSLFIQKKSVPNPGGAGVVLGFLLWPLILVSESGYDSFLLFQVYLLI